MRINTLIKGRTLWCWTLVASFLFSASDILAEPRVKKIKSADTPTGNLTAQIRMWKDLLSSDHAVRVMIRTGKKVVAEVPLGEGIQFLGYQEIPAGALLVEIVDEAASKSVMVSETLSVDGGDYFTLLVRDNAGRVDLEIIDDSVFAGATTGELSVRSFAPSLNSLRIKVGDDLNVKLSGPAPFARLRGLPKKVVQIDTSGVDSSGKQISWVNELDFQAIPRATLLIVPDVYGRIRPRIVADGASH